jgi:DNA repair exonuclease SbcCD nuclease subunit
MNSVLDNEQPDFVVLNGDLLSCEWVAFSQVNDLIDQMVAPLVERNLPFGATFGNHDMSRRASLRASPSTCGGTSRARMARSCHSRRSLSLVTPTRLDGVTTVSDIEE